MSLSDSDLAILLSQEEKFSSNIRPANDDTLGDSGLARLLAEQEGSIPEKCTSR